MNNTGVNEVFERLAQMVKSPICPSDEEYCQLICSQILDDPDVGIAEQARHGGAVKLTSVHGSNRDEEDEEDDTVGGGCSC